MVNQEQAYVFLINLFPFICLLIVIVVLYLCLRHKVKLESGKHKYSSSYTQQEKA